MASSSYYYSQMLDYSRSKRACEEKKEEYNNYLKKLENLSINLDTAFDDLVNSESNFKNGGYVNDGVPIGNDTLKNSYKSLEKSISILEKVIKKTKDRIDDINDDINKYKRLYNSANENYKEAKKRESMN